MEDLDAPILHSRRNLEHRTSSMAPIQGYRSPFTIMMPPVHRGLVIVNLQLKLVGQSHLLPLDLVMAPARHAAKVQSITESSGLAGNEEKPPNSDVPGSQGSDDHIVKNMAEALKQSVLALSHAHLIYRLTFEAD